jgi:hypothetical protein
MIVARSAAPGPLRRLSISSSETSDPAWASWSSTDALIRQTFSRDGSRPCTSPNMASWSAVSTNAALAPESPAIHSTCSADDVS